MCRGEFGVHVGLPGECPISSQKNQSGIGLKIQVGEHMDFQVAAAPVTVLTLPGNEVEEKRTPDTANTLKR